jgi:hypothetical protein
MAHDELLSLAGRRRPMTTRVRRATVGVAVAMLVALPLAGAGMLLGLGAGAALGLGRDGQLAPPYALAEPLWADALAPAGATASTPVVVGRERARAALRIIRREQRHGVLRSILGRRSARIVQLGELQQRGRTVGVTVLLALSRTRQNVRATVPAAVAPAAGGERVRRVPFVAPVLRDLLVDVDLPRGALVAVEPGPASRTSAWAAAPSAPVAAALTAAPTARAFVRLSRRGPRFATYDGTPAPGRAGRDWPVSLVFAGGATVGKVKQALRTVGFTHLGERRWLAYGAPGGAVRFDGDRGLKTATDAGGTDVHLRLYAPPRTDHFTDPRFGDVVVATAHLDRGEGSATPPRLFGFSEEAERLVADAVAGRLGWHVQRDRVALGNAEPYRRDLAAPDHVWWSNGRATLISVP